MSDQLRIWCVVITSFFHSLTKVILKTAELPSLVWCRFFYFSAICSSFRHVRIHMYIYNLVQINSQTRRLNSSQFSWLLMVLNNNLNLAAICSSVKTLPSPLQSTPHSALNFSFVLTCVPPNNPMSTCGTTPSPGYHSFPKWAIVVTILPTVFLYRPASTKL